MTADDLAATLTRALDEHADWYPRSVVDDLAPTVAALIEAAEKRGAQRALADLDERLFAARGELERMARISDGAGHPESAARLHGKAQGVGLARSYLFDTQRANKLTDTNDRSK